jgi:hypothetical protein
MAGMNISSEFPLPELLPLDFEGRPDVDIRIASVPESLPNGTQAMPEAQVAPGAVLLTIPGVARYHILAGSEIRVEPYAQAEEKDLRLFLLGSAFGAIHLQRGDFPLHASAVVIDGKAVAFAGDSGAGKSTMAAWMNAQGHSLLCDDVCVIHLNKDRGPMAFPAYPRMKLWKDALKTIGREVTGLQRDYSRADKYYMPAEVMHQGSPVPLKQIFFLGFSEATTRPSLGAITPSQAVPLLRNNTYRYQFISGLEITGQHFQDCTSIAKTVPAHFLFRPRVHSSLGQCQRLVEDLLV